MVLKKLEQVMLDSIQSTAAILKSSGNPTELILQVTKPQVDAFQLETNSVLKFNFDAEGDMFEMVSLRSDYFRIRKSGDFFVVRAKVLGVEMDIKTLKNDGSFKHSNKELIEALQETIKIIQHSGELSYYQDKIDLPRTPWDDNEEIAPETPETTLADEMPADVNMGALESQPLAEQEQAMVPGQSEQIDAAPIQDSLVHLSSKT